MPPCLDRDTLLPVTGTPKAALGRRLPAARSFLVTRCLKDARSRHFHFLKPPGKKYHISSSDSLQNQKVKTKTKTICKWMRTFKANLRTPYQVGLSLAYPGYPIPPPTPFRGIIPKGTLGFRKERQIQRTRKNGFPSKGSPSPTSWLISLSPPSRYKRPNDGKGPTLFCMELGTAITNFFSRQTRSPRGVDFRAFDQSFMFLSGIPTPMAT